jgi:hypothetical protein
MDDELPSFAMIELSFSDQEAALTVMSRGKRFRVSLTTEDLRGPQGDETLVQAFLSFRNSMDEDPQAMEALEEWMLKPCVPYMDELAPSLPRMGPHSLAEYFKAETISLKLVNREGRLDSLRCHHEASATHSLVPSVLMSDPTVSQAISKGVTRVPASQLVAVLEPDAHVADYDLIPNTVRFVTDTQSAGTQSLDTQSSNTRFHYKAAFEHHSFKRELDTLLRLRNDLNLNNSRVSRLGGLVTMENGSILGLLVEYIHGSDTLDYAVERASEAERTKWSHQIRATIKELHDAEIIWGDVKPDNVLVDAGGHGDAWVIDFGGGRCEGWVDEELEDTKEGDLQGLSRLEKWMRDGGYEQAEE